MSKHLDTNMTEGSIFRQLLFFSLPLLAGNFFQQCYNTVDSIVLGNFVGKAALAAVGTTTPIINTLIGLFLGLSAGIGVVISQFYGAEGEAAVGQAGQTAAAAGALALRGLYRGGHFDGPRHAPPDGDAGGCVRVGEALPANLLCGCVRPDAL